MIGSLFDRQVYFNSRPHGGRQIVTPLEQFVQHFNSRPHGGRLLPVRPAKTGSFHFNSRPHGGRHPGSSRPRQTFRNFNSRPHGGRLQVYRNRYYYFHFNSRPHGGRRITASGRMEDVGISTHALTEGDAHPPFRKFSCMQFQLTPSRRATIVSGTFSLL